MAYPRRDQVRVHNSVTVGIASAVLVADNPSRLSILIKNDSGSDIFIKLRTATGVNPVATISAASLKIPTAGAYTTTDYTGPIAFIAGAIGLDVTIVEV